MTAVAFFPRPDVEYTLADVPAEIAVPPQAMWHRLWNHDALRRAIVVAAFLIGWDLIARIQNNDLMLPTFSQTLLALVDGFKTGELPAKAGISLSLLLKGYGVGVA